jgi:hypothetical protein
MMLPQQLSPVVANGGAVALLGGCDQLRRPLLRSHVAHRRRNSSAGGGGASGTAGRLRFKRSDAALKSGQGIGFGHLPFPHYCRREPAKPKWR